MTLAVDDPSAELGVPWAEAATEEIVDRSDGFPFFVQTWAYHSWNVAVEEPIAATDVDRASGPVDRTPDAAFFAARIGMVLRSSRPSAATSSS